MGKIGGKKIFVLSPCGIHELRMAYQRVGGDGGGGSGAGEESLRGQLFLFIVSIWLDISRLFGKEMSLFYTTMGAFFLKKWVKYDLHGIFKRSK